jgi:hypothetical protein
LPTAGRSRLEPHLTAPAFAPQALGYFHHLADQVQQACSPLGKVLLGCALRPDKQ